MRRLRVLGLLISMLLLAAEAVGCTSSGNQSASGSTIKIALEAPLSGDQASTGIDMFDGARLAVDQANQAGGVLGKRLQLVRADDRADPSTGVQVARQMVSDGVFAVIGPYNSSVGVENLSVYLHAGVIPIHLTSNSETNGEGVTVQPKDYQIAPVEARAIIGYFKAKSAAILYDPSTYTAGIASQVKALLEQGGVDVVANDVVHPKQKDYSYLLARIEKLRPDLIYVSTYFPQGGIIAKDLQELKSRSICFMGLANQAPAFAQVAGASAARRCKFSGVPSAQGFPGASNYVTRYRAAFGTDPGTWGTFTYDSVNLLIDAVRRAGGWDEAKARQELAHTTGYEGITGSITIDPKTGNRVDVPVVILTLDADGTYSVDPKWAALAGFGS
jgi:branched-chain amino acid transport system substrate-binding protein